jgi:glycosyltransferase involved in cell wall biosynthesis
MDVSVVIPTYNRADLLPFTLRPVLAQVLPPREIIVVDDGSTDDTARVLEGFAPAVRVITIDNSGSVVARNVGLRAAAGEFVAFCDSDDLWRPDFLRRMEALWHAEPRTKVAYANFHIIAGDTWTSGSKFDQAPPGFWDGLRMVAAELGVFDEPLVERLLAFQPFFQSALVAVRRDFLEAGGWDEGVGRTVGDDFATVMRLAELKPFGVITAALVGIRKHAGNFSASVRRMNLGDANVLEYVLASRPTLRDYADPIRKSIATRRRDALDSAFADGDHGAVKSIYAMLPRHWRSSRIRLKRLLASLPPGVIAGLQDPLRRPPGVD